MQSQRESEYLERCRSTRQRFRALGIRISDWADERGYERSLVYAVLSGRVSGANGRGHQIAVDLGLKAPPDVEDEINRRLLLRHTQREVGMT